MAGRLPTARAPRLTTRSTSGRTAIRGSTPRSPTTVPCGSCPARRDAASGPTSGAKSTTRPRPVFTPGKRWTRARTRLGGGNATTQGIEIRYAEVLLNLAEAANAIGHTQEAYDQLKLLRARAGIDPGADGLYGLDAGLAGDQMQAAIMLERRIEFTFEAKRYWDLRRNMRFEPELNGTRRFALKT